MLCFLGVGKIFLSNYDSNLVKLDFPGGSEVKASASKQETRVRSLGREDPLENEMATHSGILASEMQWKEEPNGLQSMGSQRTGHD